MAANPLEGEVSLEVTAGETYILKFGFKAIALAERQHQAPLQRILDELDAGYAGAVVSTLWAALQRHHPGIDYDGAGSIMLRCDRKELTSKIIEAATLGFPKQEGGAAKARPQKAAA